MWQEIAVGAIVGLAGLYALWYWLPAAWRQRLGRVRPELAQAPACGACSTCGGCATPVDPAARPAQAGQTVWMRSKS